MCILPLLHKHCPFQSSTESQQATGDETSLVAHNNHLEVTMHTGNQDVS